MAQDQYGTYGSVPTASPDGSLGGGFSTRTSPDETIGGVAGAGLQKTGATLSSVGDQGLEIAKEHARIATETKANAYLADSFIPQAIGLRQKFDELDDAQKMQGYHDYLDDLRSLASDSMDQATSPYEKQVLSNYIKQHQMYQQEGANRELVDAQKRISASAREKILDANMQGAADDYTNTQRWDQTIAQNNGRLTLAHLENGGTGVGDSGEQLDIAKNQMEGRMHVLGFNAALQKNDLASAQKFLNEGRAMIPPDQQQVMADVLHVSLNRDNGKMTMASLMTGSAFPDRLGEPPSHVRAIVAAGAHENGVDPSDALTFLRIESMNGQRTKSIYSSRGTWLQNEVPTGTSKEDELKDAFGKMRVAKTEATKFLGRDPNPWEYYMFYNQGSGGAPALFTAAQNNDPTAAYQILAAQREHAGMSPAAARTASIRAIRANGGDPYSPASQFLDYWQKRYGDNQKLAAINTPVDNTLPVKDQSLTLASAIMAPHINQGAPVGQAVTPVAQLAAFEKNYPSMIERIKANPSPNVVEADLRHLEQSYRDKKALSEQWQQQLQDNIERQVVNGKFTSTDQIPSDLWATAQAYAKPGFVKMIQGYADENLRKLEGEGGPKSDAKKFGSSYINLFPQAIKGQLDEGTLLDALQAGGLTTEGVLKLREIKNARASKTGERTLLQGYSKSEAELQKAIRSNALGDNAFMKDEMLSSDDHEKLASAYSAYEDTVQKLLTESQEKKFPVGEIFNKDSDHYVLKNMPTGIMKTPEEISQQTLTKETANPTHGYSLLSGASDIYHRFLDPNEVENLKHFQEQYQTATTPEDQAKYADMVQKSQNKIGAYYLNGIHNAATPKDRLKWLQEAKATGIFDDKTIDAQINKITTNPIPKAPETK